MEDTAFGKSLANVFKTSATSESLYKPMAMVPDSFYDQLNAMEALDLRKKFEAPRPSEVPSFLPFNFITSQFSPASSLMSPYHPFGALFPSLMCFNNGFLPNFYAMSDFQALLGQYRNPHLPTTKAEPSHETSALKIEPVMEEVKTAPAILRPTKALSASLLKRRSDSSTSSTPPKIPRRPASTDIRRDEAEVNKFQEGVTVGYTYDALFVSDGRSKRRVNPVTSKDHQRYTCNVCQKSYATSSNLSRHKQTHRALDSNFAKTCPDCGKVYVSMPALSMHLLTHKLEHKCTVCDKAFSRPWLLQGHMRSHSGSKPYGCLHCGKAFADRSNLRAHMQTHSGLKRYSCTTCGKKFALKSYLNKHVESACVKDSSATFDEDDDEESLIVDNV